MVLKWMQNNGIKATLCLARKKLAKAQRGLASRKSRTNEYAPL
jgi:hypothetical protein